ncbi:MAG: TOBE domain-containing protein, partial [Oscillospiraceae bacterium]|nr:TOBE domain-containing protein [Oscillospiraceae bacterium]
ITLGVRPEHITLTDSGVPAHVDVSEMLGSAVHLHVNAEGRDVVVIVQIKDGAVNHDLEMGADIHLTFDGSMMHVFSKETEQNLEF